MTDQTQRPTPAPQPIDKAGAEQLLTEAVACLILRGDVDHIVIEVEERAYLYEMFKRGFGLAVYEDPQTFRVKLSLVGQDGLPLLADMIRAGTSRDGRFDRSKIPSFLKIDPDRPTP